MGLQHANGATWHMKIQLWNGHCMRLAFQYMNIQLSLWIAEPIELRYYLQDNQITLPQTP